jgi:hypothetical protein
VTHRQPQEPWRPPGRTATRSGLLRAIPETSPGPPPTRDNPPASLPKLNRREPYDRKNMTPDRRQIRTLLTGVVANGYAGRPLTQG